MDVRVKFDDYRSNRCRDIRATHFVMDDDDDDDERRRPTDPVVRGPKNRNYLCNRTTAWSISAMRTTAHGASIIATVLVSISMGQCRCLCW